MSLSVRLSSALLLVIIAGCTGTGRRDGVPSGRLDPDNIVDAQPRREPITRAGNKSPYTVLGRTYHLLPTAKGYRARGTASWYGSKFHGNSTANGETYDAMAMTAAHCTLPIPSYVQVTNLENGRRAIVRVNDRGPFVNNRIIDLSYAAATKLGYTSKGTALVEVTAIDVDNWAPGEGPPSRAMADMPAPVEALPPQTAQPEIAAPRPKSSAAGGGVAGDDMPGAGPVYVQAGAFASESAAQNLRRQLEQDTGHTVVVQSTSSGLYRVRIGPFNSRELAEQVRSDLAAGPARGARVVGD